MNKKQIQTLLNIWLKSRGLTLLKVDGIIGPLSKGATKEFQSAHGLKVDGIPGPLTQYELMFYKYPSFKKSEFKCKCGGKFCNGYPVRVDENLLILLQKIRQHFGKPVIINSGIRCEKHNASKDVKGEPDSQHLYGTAADFRVVGVKPSEVYSYAHKINPNGGVGSYSTFTHVDTRGKRARW